MRRPPSPIGQDIKAERIKAGLTQAEAAALIYCGLRAWQQWEQDVIEMHPQLWESFRVKIDRLARIRDKKAQRVRRA